MKTTDYKKKGLIPRYDVKRADGQDEDPEAKFFVLRYDKDDVWGRKCREALREFAASIKSDYPRLAAELRASVNKAEQTP